MRSIFNEYSDVVLDTKSDFVEKLLSLIHKKENTLIGVVGYSASGKSTFVKEIQKSKQKSNLPISFLNADNYYKDISNIVKLKNKNVSTLIKDGEIDLDCPDAFDLNLLRDDLLKLKNGSNILSPKYSMDGTGVSIQNQIPVESNNIIVVDGISGAYNNIFDIFDIKIYIDTDENLLKERFISRAKERKTEEDDVIEMWEKVFKAGKKYIEPRREEVDIIINGGFDVSVVDTIIGALNEFIRKNSRFIK